MHPTLFADETNSYLTKQGIIYLFQTLHQELENISDSGLFQTFAKFKEAATHFFINSVKKKASYLISHLPNLISTLGGGWSVGLLDKNVSLKMDLK